MKIIELTQGKITFVDDEDFEWLSQWKWYYNQGYAVRKTSPKILMHREIVNAPDGKQVDHINRNGLDNRKNNLRICTLQENRRNKKLYKNNKSGHRGVWFFKHKTCNYQKWMAYITHKGKRIFLGHFDNKEDAIKVRLKAEKKYFGEFAPQRGGELLSR